jgi:hypothetical protein
MSTTGPFDTGYIGAHRWHVEDTGAFHWTCVCGDTGNAVGNLSFVLHSFGRHAHEKLMEAAIKLVLAPLPHQRHIYTRLVMQAEQAKEAGDIDRHNLLMMAASERSMEAAEAMNARYVALSWEPGPTTDITAEVSDWVAPGWFWMSVWPGERGWSWETGRLIQDDTLEDTLGKGSAPSQAEAQRASWEAVVRFQEQMEDADEEPF